MNDMNVKEDSRPELPGDACSATPEYELEELVMNPCRSKRDTEWWAMREIEKLRDRLMRVRVAANGGSEPVPEKLESIIRQCAERLRYLADSAPPEELRMELHALARHMEDHL